MQLLHSQIFGQETLLFYITAFSGMSDSRAQTLENTYAENGFEDTFRINETHWKIFRSNI